MKFIAAGILAMFVAALVTGCTSQPKQESSSPPATAPVPESAKTAPFPMVDSPPDKISCARGKEVRVLEVVKKPHGCVFAYTKSGKITEPASSSHGIKHCQDSQKKVRAKLETAGYVCTT